MTPEQLKKLKVAFGKLWSFYHLLTEGEEVEIAALADSINDFSDLLEDLDGPIDMEAVLDMTMQQLNQDLSQVGYLQ
jgi:hypothetical protein